MAVYKKRSQYQKLNKNLKQQSLFWIVYDFTSLRLTHELPEIHRVIKTVVLRTQHTPPSRNLHLPTAIQHRISRSALNPIRWIAKENEEFFEGKTVVSFSRSERKRELPYGVISLQTLMSVSPPEVCCVVEALSFSLLKVRRRYSSGARAACSRKNSLHHYT